MTNDLKIEDQVSYEESVTLDKGLAYGGGTGEMDVPAVIEDVDSKEETAEQSRLSAGEKVMFAGAAIFATTMLVIGVMLTIAGFIFSPATETIAFGLLTGAFGLTLYVIWRGGR